MTESKPVFVICTAADCGACKNLYNRWGEIRDAIKDLGTVRIVEIKLETRATSVTTKGYPNDLQRYVLWYPTAFLFTGKNWDDAMKDKNTKLDGVIFNGIVGNPNPQQGYMLNADGITTWIKDTLQNNDKFSPKHAEISNSPRDPRSSLYARVQKEKYYIPTSGSAAICRKMKLKPKNSF